MTSGRCTWWLCLKNIEFFKAGVIFYAVCDGESLIIFFKFKRELSEDCYNFKRDDKLALEYYNQNYHRQTLPVLIIQGWKVTSPSNFLTLIISDPSNTDSHFNHDKWSVHMQSLWLYSLNWQLFTVFDIYFKLILHIKVRIPANFDKTNPHPPSLTKKWWCE
jgi:hypothetical protein